MGEAHRAEKRCDGEKKKKKNKQTNKQTNKKNSKTCRVNTHTFSAECAGWTLSEKKTKKQNSNRAICFFFFLVSFFFFFGFPFKKKKSKAAPPSRTVFPWLCEKRRLKKQGQGKAL
jgi:hypothetical protein